LPSVSVKAIDPLFDKLAQMLDKRFHWTAPLLTVLDRLWTGLCFAYPPLRLIQVTPAEWGVISNITPSERKVEDRQGWRRSAAIFPYCGITPVAFGKLAGNTRPIRRVGTVATPSQRGVSMRLRMAAIAGAVSLALNQPAAALDGNSAVFVAGMTVFYVTATYCEGFEFVEKGLQKAAERNGIDPAIARAAANAIFTQMDAPYDPKDLIPEVTILVRDTIVGVKRTIAENRVENCKNYGESAVNAGILRRKNGPK
jgi:hypothetical protein